MKCKKLFVLMLSMLLITVSMFSASAARDTTEDYYIYDYKAYGTTITSSQMVYSSTYCEYAGYGKSVYLTYYYKVNNIAYPMYFGSLTSYVVNGFDTYSVDYTYASGRSNAYSAEGEHRVKASSTIIWMSAECENVGDAGEGDNSYVRGI